MSTTCSRGGTTYFQSIILSSNRATSWAMSTSRGSQAPSRYRARDPDSSSPCSLSVSHVQGDDPWLGVIVNKGERTDEKKGRE